MKNNNLSIKALFRKFDKDNDNFICFPEFISGLKDILKLKLSEKEID